LSAIGLGLGFGLHSQTTRLLGPVASKGLTPMHSGKGLRQPVPWVRWRLKHHSSR